ncbi:hypothetical protein N7540_008056 [Penicillium herquei]|nr:hypothetical protein N7540_008056 [Penicillium herquei]
MSSLKNTMKKTPITVIDLTDDDNDVEMQDAMPLTQPQLKTKDKNGDEDMTFVSTLAHRQTGSVVPTKRKSLDPENSKGPSDALIQPKEEKTSAAPEGPNVKISRSSTPASKSGRKARNSGGFEVVIPSPSQKDKGKTRTFYPKPSDLRGMQEKDYPLIGPDAPWVQTVDKKKYPNQREPVDRSIVPFNITTGTPSQFPRIPAASLLRLRLREETKKIKGPPITFDVDDEKLSLLSSTFGFINDYVLLNGVERVDEGFNSGCNCKSGQCNPATCDCLYNEEDSDETIKTYHSMNGKIVLRPSFLSRRSKITECNALCSCKGKCWNTVVQAGRKVPLQVFHTGDRGFGLRSPEPIAAGQFIDRYLGEVITHKEADARELANEQGMSYLFILDWETPEESNDGEEPPTQPDFFVVDGQKFGSPTRFINHSCNPNCKIIPVATTHHGDNRLYDLAFFALRDIAAGTELTFDYNPTSLAPETSEKVKRKKSKRKSKKATADYGDTSRYTSNNKAQGPNIVKCLCGEKNCRGQLWLRGYKKQSVAQPGPQAAPPPGPKPAVAGPSTGVVPRIKIKGPKTPPKPAPKRGPKPSLKGKERAT